jgi:2-keto-4-pentenoate hydratase
LIEKAARLLSEAERTGIPCKPVRHILGHGDIAAAYAVQSITRQARLANGHEIAGWKIGATTEVIQKHFGLSHPEYGALFRSDRIPDNGTIRLGEIMQPKVEGEIAFVLAKDIRSGKVNEQHIIDSTAYVCASLELLGSRIISWDVRAVDTIADNGCASHWVLGNKKVSLKDVDLMNCRMTLEKNGQVVSEGLGANVLGSPIDAVVWLANALIEAGEFLRAGDVILSGALSGVSDAIAGDHFRARFGTLGEVSTRFVDK